MALSAAASRQEILTALAERGAQAAGAHACLVHRHAAPVDRRIVTHHGYPPGQVEAYVKAHEARFPAFEDRLERGEPIFLPDAGTVRAAFPSVPGTPDVPGAVAILPLRTHGRPFGSLTFSFPHPSAFDEAERAFLGALAGSFQQALTRAEVVEAERQARHELSAATAIIDAFVREAPVGLALLDRSLRYVRVNDLIAQVNGHDAERHAGRTVEEASPHVAALVRPQFEEVLRTGRTLRDVRLEGRDPDHTGARRTWRATHFPVRGGAGEVLGVGTLVVETTEQERAQEALRASEARLRSLIDHFPHGAVVLFDHDLRYLFAGGQGLADVNLRPETLVGSTLTELFPGEIAGRLEGPYRDALAGHPTTTEVSFAGRVFLARVAPVRGEDGAVLAGLLITQDITDLKTAEDSLRRLNATLNTTVEERTRHLQDLHAELRAYTAAMSRDLQEPARRIEAFLGLLARRLDETLDERSRGYLTMVQNEARRVGDLVTQLLNLSLLERRELRQDAVPLNVLVTQVRSDLAPGLAGRAVEWAVEDLPVVRGDALMLRQVFAELFAGALDAAHHERVAVIEVSAETGGGTATVRVRDNAAGPGLGEAEALFEVGARAPGEVGVGARVGLANVRRIVERHGGRVWVEDAGGVVFALTLPLA
ncbi:PAS domain-containing protein [Deinococcus pimensis]|uniref:PAS domain-containing protein n=1 Tax=Deinococcus pimensis TaxID=309888 RepID=UPI0004AE4BCB|nr:PAS domain-containing protein [Deinococcus pimensis]